MVSHALAGYTQKGILKGRVTSYEQHQELREELTALL